MDGSSDLNGGEGGGGGGPETQTLVSTCGGGAELNNEQVKRGVERRREFGALLSDSLGCKTVLWTDETSKIRTRSKSRSGKWDE